MSHKNTCKFIITLTGLLLYGNLLYGQNVKINVISGEERLAYAYVYVNGTVVGVTDTLGVFALSSEQLHRGDTLSASFVGFSEGQVIYNGDTSRNPTIYLRADYVLEPVIVSAQRINMLRLLRRHTNFPQWIATRDKEFALSFESDITNDGIEHRSEGDIKLALSPRLDLDPRYKCLSLDALGDTTEIVNRVGSTMIAAMKTAQSLSMAGAYKNAIITSRGIVGDERIFILSYTHESGSTQILLHVDKEEKNIRSFEWSYLSSNLTVRSDMNVQLSPYGRNKSIVIQSYEWNSSLSSTGRSEEVTVDSITESPHRNTWDLFLDEEGNPK
jgi:hypothetical protein